MHSGLNKRRSSVQQQYTAAVVSVMATLCRSAVHVRALAVASLSLTTRALLWAVALASSYTAAAALCDQRTH
jgi:hypothetical protein